MTSDKSSYHDGLTDSDFDRFLTAVNKDLLAYIETAADPTLTLTAIMDGIASASRSADGGVTITASVSNARRTPAVLAIGIRSINRGLARTRGLARGIGIGLDPGLVLARVLVDVDDLKVARELARTVDIELTRNLAGDRGRVLALEGVLVVILGLARILDHGDDVTHSSGLARDLARVLDQARDLARILDLAHDLADNLTRNLTRTRDLARALNSAVDLVDNIHDALAHDRALASDLARHLYTQRVDASGADLSDIAIEDVDVLDGVIWTDQTTWPPGIADQVRACSREIRPGVYQVVQGGNDLDRAELISV